MTVPRRELLPGSEREYRTQSRMVRRVKGKQLVVLCMPGAGLSSVAVWKASAERSALKPYRGKPAVRNFREGHGNGGIIEARLAP
jgi:hypothetical protein